MEHFQMLTYKELWEIQEPLLAMASVIQIYVHFSGGLNRWKDATADWWVNLQLIAWPERYQISEKFLEAFNIVYGAKTFSWRRLFTTVLFSTFFVVCFYWLLVRIGIALFQIPDERFVAGNFYYSFVGYGESTIHWLAPLNLVMLVYDSLGTNVIPDFVSLAETAWILRLASKKDAQLFPLILLDFFLTTAIWIVAFVVAFLFTGYIIYGGGYDFETILAAFSFSSDPATGANPLAVWALVATTYTTSLIWVVFLCTTSSIAVLKRTTTALVALVESKWVTQLPIVCVVGIPCLVAWPVLFILRQLM